MEHHYRYFAHPHDFSTYLAEPKRCDLCANDRPGFSEPFYGERDDITFVCEKCLIAGKLEEAELFTNEGDVKHLTDQLHARQPEMAEEEIEALVRASTAELHHRTPHVVTWQDFFWPAHCGDYMLYVKEVGQPEIALLAPDGDGLSFFASHMTPPFGDLDDTQSLWDGIRPDVPENGRSAYSIGVYHFLCLTCGEVVFHWDAD